MSTTRKQMGPQDQKPFFEIQNTWLGLGIAGLALLLIALFCFIMAFYALNDDELNAAWTLVPVVLAMFCLGALVRQLRSGYEFRGTAIWYRDGANRRHQYVSDLNHVSVIVPKIQTNVGGNPLATFRSLTLWTSDPQRQSGLMTSFATGGKRAREKAMRDFGISDEHGAVVVNTQFLGRRGRDTLHQALAATGMQPMSPDATWPLVRHRTLGEVR